MTAKLQELTVPEAIVLVALAMVLLYVLVRVVSIAFWMSHADVERSQRERALAEDCDHPSPDGSSAGTRARDKKESAVE